MKKLQLYTPKIISAAIISTLLVACNSNNDDPQATSTSSTTSTITGTATKGTLKSAVVTAYKVQADGSKGEKLAEVRTDNNGNYSLIIKNYTGAVLLELTSDAATKMVCDIVKGCGAGVVFGSETSTSLALSTVLASAAGNPKSAITPYTYMATKFAQSKSGGLKKANIDSAFSQIQQIFDLPDLQNTVLSDATKTLPASLDIQRYALLNAAIGQLATNMSDIQIKLDALVEQLKTNNGQLKSSEAGTANTMIDLADVLKAAKETAESNKLAGLNSLVKTFVVQRLTEVQANTNLTNIQPISTAGIDDIAKGKAFVNSVKELVTKAQDLQSLETTLTTKTQAVSTLSDQHALISDAVGAVVNVLTEAYHYSDEGRVSTTLTSAQVQALLNNNFTSKFSVTASPNTTITVNSTSVTMNGQLSITEYGQTRVYTVSNFKLNYPSLETLAKAFEIKIDPAGVISSSDMKFSLMSDSNSKVIVSYAAEDTLLNHLAAADAVGELPLAHIPNALDVKLDRAVFEAPKAPDTEFSKFVGTINLSMTNTDLAITTGGSRKFPVANIVSLFGGFSSKSGDNLEATLTIDLSGSNPKITPASGSVRQNLYTYSYNAATDTATLTANNGLFNVYSQPDTTTLTFTETNGCLLLNNQMYLGCYEVNNVPQGLAALFDESPLYLTTKIDKEGEYTPNFGSEFNFGGNSNVNGVLEYSEDSYIETSTNFIKPTISLSAKAKLGTQEVSANITAKRTSYGTNGKDGNGEFMADFNVGADKLSFKAPVIGGLPVYTLTNKDNVSVEVNILNEQEKLEIKVAGKVIGWIYRVNNLPIAKFVDNSLMSL